MVEEQKDDENGKLKNRINKGTVTNFAQTHYFETEDGLLYYFSQPDSEDPRFRLYVSQEIENIIIRQYHDQLEHLALDKTYDSMRLKYFFPNMYRKLKSRSVLRVWQQVQRSHDHRFKKRAYHRIHSPRWHWICQDRIQEKKRCQQPIHSFLHRHLLRIAGIVRCTWQGSRQDWSSHVRRNLPKIRMPTGNNHRQWDRNRQQESSRNSTQWTSITSRRLTTALKQIVAWKDSMRRSTPSWWIRSKMAFKHGISTSTRLWQQSGSTSTSHPNSLYSSCSTIKMCSSSGYHCEAKKALRRRGHAQDCAAATT